MGRKKSIHEKIVKYLDREKGKKAKKKNKNGKKTKSN